MEFARGPVVRVELLFDAAFSGAKGRMLRWWDAASTTVTHLL